MTTNEKARTGVLIAKIALDLEGKEHVWVEFSRKWDSIVVHHTKLSDDLQKQNDMHPPFHIPANILGPIIRVLEDANKYLRPKVK